MIGAEISAMLGRVRATSRSTMTLVAHAGVHLPTSCQAAHSHRRLGQMMRRHFDARDILMRRRKNPISSPQTHAAHGNHRRVFARDAQKTLRGTQCHGLVAPDRMRGSIICHARSLRSLKAIFVSLWNAARRRVWLKMAATPASSATRSEPVDDPMNTFMPAAPGKRSRSGISRALSCVPPTQKAKCNACGPWPVRLYL